MSIRRRHAVPFTRRNQHNHIGLTLLVISFLFLTAPPGLGQRSAPEDGGAPQYDQKTESKTKGVIDEVKLLTVGSRKDFVELILKNGDAQVSAYVCPKPFEDEMGITLAKGDEITLTGSKIKQQDSDVVLVRELEKGTDTFMFRDDKGKPVWDWRTGK
jgi:hypothetical protein